MVANYFLRHNACSSLDHFMEIGHNQKLWEVRMSTKFLCIHGHFYQPPREDPWIEAIEPQASAAPWDNWNARISSECYAPNGLSRIRGASGAIVKVANNYSRISFNFGPTLLSWMAVHDPDSLEAIVQGDQLSAARLNGHGNAIAQAYNHMIMPLASERDQRTQVRWGIADFVHRFGRRPEGMWLPETAVDSASLETLAAEGIRFTLLAPRQAKRIRPRNDSAWVDAQEGTLNTGQAYLVKLPSGREISVFFYDGDIAHGIAFAGLLDSGDKLAQALRAKAQAHPGPFLVNTATDGESYGHHHKFGDMALAWALDDIEQHGQLQLSNYAAFLADNPPSWEAEIVENSSWSCAHGVERWRSDCGCNVGTPGFNQRWRAPLRDSLDALKTQLDAIFEREAGALFADPWAVRDAYIDLLLDRDSRKENTFLSRHAGRDLNASEAQRALSLLEMQRHGMLMFTSCGWFFDEFSGLEGRQILRYAARAMQLAADFGAALEDDFVDAIAKAESNDPQYTDGRDVWLDLVRPQKVPLERVAAHYAMAALFDQRPDAGQLYSYQLDDVDERIDAVGDLHLAVGKVTVRSRLTRCTRPMHFAALHFGGMDVQAWVHEARDEERFADLRTQAMNLFATASMGDVYEHLRKGFGGEAYTLVDMFPRERAHLIDMLIGERLATYHSVLAGLVQPDLGMVERLWRVNYPLPLSVALAAEIYIEQEISEIFLAMDEPGLKRIKGYSQRGHRLSKARRHNLARILEQQLLLAIQTHSAAGHKHAVQLFEAGRELGLEVNLWASQNALLKNPGPVDQTLTLDLAQHLGLAPHLLLAHSQ